IICIDVLPLQFFPCHCLAPNVGCLDQTESVAFSAKWPSSLLWERDDFLWHHDLSISNASRPPSTPAKIVMYPAPSLSKYSTRQAPSSSRSAARARLRGSSGRSFLAISTTQHLLLVAVPSQGQAVRFSDCIGSSAPPPK